jgi:hypothetical protein
MKSFPKVPLLNPTVLIGLVATMALVSYTGSQGIAAPCQGPAGLVHCKQVPAYLDVTSCTGEGAKTCNLVIPKAGTVQVEIYEVMAAPCQGPTGLVGCKKVQARLDVTSCTGEGAKTCNLVIPKAGTVIPKTGTVQVEISYDQFNVITRAKTKK